MSRRALKHRAAMTDTRPQMRKRVNIIAVVAAAVTLTISVGAGEAQPVTRAAPAHKYINPFTDPAWSPARTDMGVDWIPQKRLPVLAIGDALILGPTLTPAGPAVASSGTAY